MPCHSMRRVHSRPAHSTGYAVQMCRSTLSDKHEASTPGSRKDVWTIYQCSVHTSIYIPIITPGLHAVCSLTLTDAFRNASVQKLMLLRFLFVTALICASIPALGPPRSEQEVDCPLWFSSRLGLEEAILSSFPSLWP